MALPDLTGNKIKDTYQRVVQTGDGKTFYNGTGSAIPIVTNPYTGSLAISGGVVINGTTLSGGNLNGLSDVVITNPQLGDLLVRDTYSTNWVNSQTLDGDYTYNGTNVFTNETTHNGGIYTAGDITAGADLAYNIGGDPARDYWFATASIGYIRTFQGGIEFVDPTGKTPQAVLTVNSNGFTLNNAAGAKTNLSASGGTFTSNVSANRFVGPLTGAVTGSVLGNLTGTASLATTASFATRANVATSATSSTSASYAVTASYVLNAVSSSFATTASYALNGGVTQIIAGTNVSISPAGGTGAVTISSTGGGGGGSTFPYTGSAIISGSLIVTGSTAVSGGISTQYIDFDINTVPAFSTGRVNWVDDTKTIAIDTELSGFQIEVGHQNVIRVRNETGTTISRGRVVYLSGSSGNRPLIYTSSFEIDPTSAGTVGLVAADISTSNNGYVISNGLIRDINTTAYTAGAVLYLSSSGQLSTTAPVAPLHGVRLGKVITSAVSGIIHVDVDNGYEIGELHDVIDNSTNTTYGALLVKSGSVWKNGYQLTGSYGLTGSLAVQGSGLLLDIDGDIQFNENRIRTSSTTVGQPGKGADLAYDWGNFTTAPTAGRIVYFASGSGGFGWRDALASATGSSIGPLGVATNAASQDEIMLRGAVRVSGSLSGLAAGQVVYLSNTVSGSVTGTAPSTTGHVVRIIGYVISPTDNTMYFNPDFSYITRT